MFNKRFKIIAILLIVGLFTVSSVACNRQNVENTPKISDPVQIERSFVESAPIYRTLTQLAADADYVFLGTLSSIEPVQGARWQWEIFEVKKLYKGIETAQEIRMIAETTPAPETEKHEIGSEYYVFASAYELPVYPYPIINPIYGQTAFKVMGDGQLSLEGIVDKEMLPAVFDENFTKHPEEAISQLPGLSQARSMAHVVDRYSSLTDMVTDSDLVVRVIFGEAEKINQYVTLGKIKETVADYKMDSDIPLPISIALNETVRPGEEYILFLKRDSLGESYQLASREGAIVNQANDENQWNDVLEILN